LIRTQCEILRRLADFMLSARLAADKHRSSKLRACNGWSRSQFGLKMRDNSG
jgi:hypothetical protein